MGQCFFCPRAEHRPFFQAVWVAFPLDQGLQLDSLWSRGDFHFDNSLADHGVSETRARQDRLGSLRVAAVSPVAARSHGPSVCSDLRGSKQLPDLISSGLRCGLACQKQRRKSKNGLWLKVKGTCVAHFTAFISISLCPC